LFPKAKIAGILTIISIIVPLDNWYYIGNPQHGLEWIFGEISLYQRLQFEAGLSANGSPLMMILLEISLILLISGALFLLVKPDDVRFGSSIVLSADIVLGVFFVYTFLFPPAYLRLGYLPIGFILAVLAALVGFI
jgi:hypothetical protein